MHQSMSAKERYIVRFTFKPGEARDFAYGDQQVVEMELDSLEEIVEYCKEFQESLLDVNAIVGGRVINASDFPL